MDFGISTSASAYLEVYCFLFSPKTVYSKDLLYFFFKEHKLPTYVVCSNSTGTYIYVSKYMKRPNALVVQYIFRWQTIGD